SSPITAFQQNRNTMAKINFPREMIILVSLCEVFFNALIRCVILIVFLLLFGLIQDWSLQSLLFPVAFGGLILTGMTIGLFLVPLGALYLDIGKFLTIITPIWMILTPIIYPTPMNFPGNLLVYANLASPTLVTARDCLLGQEPHYQLVCWISLAALLPVFLLGVLLYRVSIPIILERSGN
ncbi:MAG: hypothetical protein VX438_07565, partial [Planctomycetota bacterium]|nr:hypothetical protein [Planctomycetota bacterium]